MRFHFSRPIGLGLLIGCLAACSTTPQDPNEPLTAGERSALQNECVKIPERNERQACLDRAAFGGPRGGQP